MASAKLQNAKKEYVSGYSETTGLMFAIVSSVLIRWCVSLGNYSGRLVIAIIGVDS